MASSSDYLQAVNYETYPAANQAELDLAVSYALAGKAAVRSQLKLGEGSFRRRGPEVSCELNWTLPESQLPETHYEELLALAWAVDGSRFCRHGDTDIARICRITARAEFKNRAAFTFSRFHPQLELRGYSSIEGFLPKLDELIDADVRAMSQEKTWMWLLHRLAGLFLVVDEIERVHETAGEIVLGSWSKVTRAEEFRKLIEGE